MPELHSHFEEEEVNFKECATSWFRYFLSKELPFECNLWISYFNSTIMLTLILSLICQACCDYGIHTFLLRMDLISMLSFVLVKTFSY
jgi:hypothetical protein